MPKSWAMVDSNFPTFTGDENPREQIRALVDYMFVLVEELKFQLENLDTSNWNSSALKTFQSDTTKDVNEKVETQGDDLASMTGDVAVLAANLSLLTNEVAVITNRVSALESLSGRMKDVEIDIAYLQKDLNEFIAEIREVLQIDEETGAITIGEEGRDLHLVGNVYINDQLMG